MIPKRLIFIWIGKNIPKYGIFCMNSFKLVNPDFEIKFVHIDDIKNTDNIDFREFSELLNDHSTIYYNRIHRKWARNNLTTEKGKITAISDSFRLFLLNKYGGIYLDLDTFPVSQFDNKLLGWTFGFTVSHHDNSPDYFFMGFERNCVDNGYVTPKQKIPHKIKYYDKWMYNQKEKFKENKELFLNGTLRFGNKCYNPEPREYYIDHFRINSWKS